MLTPKEISATTIIGAAGFLSNLPQDSTPPVRRTAWLSWRDKQMADLPAFQWEFARFAQVSGTIRRYPDGCAPGPCISGAVSPS